MSYFQGKTAVITGAAGGIGSGLARHGAKLGMNLVLIDAQEDGLTALAASLDSPAIARICDVGDFDALQKIAYEAANRFGLVDIVFNNAALMRTGLIWEVTPEDWELCLRTNISGTLNGIRAFLPAMLEADRGLIVNTSSVGGFSTGAMLGPYVTTKYAISAMTETLAQDLQTVGSAVKAALLVPAAVKSSLMDGSAGANRRSATLDLVQMLSQTLADNGLEPIEFAAAAFAAIERGEFWIFPQPEAIDSTVEERTRIIRERIAPGEPHAGTVTSWVD